jgi:hypothetical protein
MCRFSLTSCPVVIHHATLASQTCLQLCGLSVHFAAKQAVKRCLRAKMGVKNRRDGTQHVQNQLWLNDVQLADTNALPRTGRNTASCLQMCRRRSRRHCAASESWWHTWQGMPPIAGRHCKRNAELANAAWCAAQRDICRQHVSVPSQDWSACATWKLQEDHEAGPPVGRTEQPSSAVGHDAQTQMPTFRSRATSPSRVQIERTLHTLLPAVGSGNAADRPPNKYQRASLSSPGGVTVSCHE